MLSRPALLLIIALLAGCSRIAPPGPGQPLVVGLPADSVFQQAAPPTEGLAGYSRDITAMFAQGLGAGVSYVTAPNQPALLKLVRDGRVHLAAAVQPLPSDPVLRFTAPICETRQIIVQHADALQIDTPGKLSGREVTAMPGAQQIGALQLLGISPPAIIRMASGIDELELLARVARGRLDLAATDDLHYAVAANLYPELAIAQELPGKLAYGWAVAAADTKLFEQAQGFLDGLQRDGTLNRLHDRYFGHIRRLNARDMDAFLAQTRNRLPDLRPAFQEAQEVTGIDWRLLAALAYQESKWDTNATSYTGVRGIMMLTEETADRLGVDNRVDARQSIRAGAKYLDLLMSELPPEIKRPDRLWFALAAYNLGMGHLKGARAFAPGLQRDPNSWADMKKVLPLMARPEYYEKLKSGRARGGEAVILVENVRNYYDVLSRLEPVYTPPSLSKPRPIRKTGKKKSGARPTPPRA